MSFYRTYRPLVIEEIDNAAIREQLLSLLHKEKEKLPHAFLFSGPKGTGKTTAARIIAKIFNCEKLSKRTGPCGKCEQCSSIAKGNNLDVIEIDAASNRGIDEIRALRDQINLAPVSGEYKVYIIDEVHMLTMEAFNALLKTLEEPPVHAVFVLATTDLHKVPSTIVSRAVQIVFSVAKVEELLASLKRITRKEKIDIEKDALMTIAAQADGSFRDATKLLEQVSFYRGKISVDVVRRLLSVSDEKILEQFMGALAGRKKKEMLEIIGTMTEKGSDMKTFLIDLLQRLEFILVEQVKGREFREWEAEKLQEAIRKFSAAFTEMRSTPISQLPLELAIVEFCGQEIPKEKPEPVGSLTLEKLKEHWPDVIETLKTYNHSVSGVLRSSRPKAVGHGIVTIEAFYPFHQEKLSEPKTKDMLSQTVKKLFGEKVKVEIILGKK